MCSETYLNEIGLSRRAGVLAPILPKIVKTGGTSLEERVGNAHALEERLELASRATQTFVTVWKREM